MRKAARLLAFIMFAGFVMPTLVTLSYGQFNEARYVYEGGLEGGADGFEDYIVSVVAAEMPAGFNEEALKAQAVAARTYAANQLREAPGITPEALGQQHLSIDELRGIWGKDFDANYKKIRDCVYATRGEVMLYGEEPILAVFHSTSGGLTESSGNVWSQELPYLVSVDSASDVNSPQYLTEKAVSAAEFIRLLGGKAGDTFSITKKSDAGYVLEAAFGEARYTGAQIRAVFGLNSSNFTVRQEGNDIIFTCRGYGHGVGMSQYGAEFMARDGADYREILSHYYSGVSFGVYSGS